jgi:hypothetical protein
MHTPELDTENLKMSVKLFLSSWNIYLSPVHLNLNAHFHHAMLLLGIKLNFNQSIKAFIHRFCHIITITINFTQLVMIRELGNHAH